MLDGKVLWLDDSEDKLIRSDGSSFVDLKGSGRFDTNPLVHDEEGYSVKWTSPVFFDTPDGNFAMERSFLSRVNSDGAIGETLQYDHTARFGPEINGTARIGNASFDPKDYPDWNWFPSIFDVSARQVRPILNPFGERGQIGRNLVVAVQVGRFARIVNTDNTCLNIHSAPRPDAPILDCSAEGVLLVLGIGTGDYPNVVDVDGTPWLSVITPNGVDGFASTQYLQR